MTKRASNDTHKSHPFYIGQSHDDVIFVARKTGRRRIKLEVLDNNGDPTTAEKIDLTADLIFRSTYPDVTLTFQRGRGEDSKVPRCYRITQINQCL